MLVLSRKVNETIVVGDVIEVTVLEVVGERVKIGINAPREVSIVRQELLDQVQAENVVATQPGGTSPAEVARELRRKSTSSRFE